MKFILNPDIAKLNIALPLRKTLYSGTGLQRKSKVVTFNLGVTYDSDDYAEFAYFQQDIPRLMTPTVTIAGTQNSVKMDLQKSNPTGKFEFCGSCGKWKIRIPMFKEVE